MVKKKVQGLLNNVGLNCVGPLICGFFFNNYTVSVIGYKAAHSTSDVADTQKWRRKNVVVMASAGIEPTTLVLLASCTNPLS